MDPKLSNLQKGVVEWAIRAALADPQTPLTKRQIRSLRIAERKIMDAWHK